MKKEREKRSVFGTLLRVLGCLVLAVVIAFAVLMYAIPAFEQADRTPVAGTADWMAGLNDNLLLSDVVLPGTHDSATKNVQLAYFSKCQSLTIGEQLEAGFRYLDVRLGVDGDRLKFMHGFTNCTETGWPWSKPLYLDSVLEECYAFLDAHPTETVVFCVKKERNDDPAAEFQSLLMTEIGKQPDRWVLGDAIPTVETARGKIVLLRLYEDTGYGNQSGFELIWENQDNRDDVEPDAALYNRGSFLLSVQDRYKYDADDKWTAFLDGIESYDALYVFSTSYPPRIVSLNFLSTNGNTSYGHPYKYAKDLNARFRNALAAGADSGNLVSGDRTVELKGWIIVDFASPALAESIYRINFLTR